MSNDKNNLNQIISQIKVAFHKSKTVIELSTNDSEKGSNYSNQQNTTNPAYSEHLEQNRKVQNFIHKKNFNSEIRSNIYFMNLVDVNDQISNK
jgi:hypothetical protein